ncbi:unnamed protein product, partial [Amoebophrya sp. A25]
SDHFRCLKNAVVGRGTTPVDHSHSAHGQRHPISSRKTTSNGPGRATMYVLEHNLGRKKKQVRKSYVGVKYFGRLLRKMRPSNAFFRLVEEAFDHAAQDGA